MTVVVNDVAEPQLVIPPVIDPESLVPDEGAELIRLGGDTMGTSWSVAAAVAPGFDEARLEDCIYEGFSYIIGQMSQWYDKSELARFNAAGPGSWHDISPQFAIVIRTAIALMNDSGGLFNPAIGSLSEAWGFGVEPHRDAIPTALYQGANVPPLPEIVFDEQRRGLFQPGGLSLDMSGIAQGVAVDYTAAILKREGVRHMLVEIGGELAACGVRPDGQPWWVDIERAPGDEGPPVRVALSNWAVATTGHYLRRRLAEGKSWSHTIDPREQRPVGDDVTAVSVIHQSCMAADGIATLMAVMGADAGPAFADARRLPVRFTGAHGVRCSDAWLRYAAQ